MHFWGKWLWPFDSPWEKTPWAKKSRKNRRCIAHTNFLKFWHTVTASFEPFCAGTSAYFFEIFCRGQFFRTGNRVVIIIFFKLRFQIFQSICTNYSNTELLYITELKWKSKILVFEIFDYADFSYGNYFSISRHRFYSALGL